MPDRGPAGHRQPLARCRRAGAQVPSVPSVPSSAFRRAAAAVRSTPPAPNWPSGPSPCRPCADGGGVQDVAQVVDENLADTITGAALCRPWSRTASLQATQSSARPAWRAVATVPQATPPGRPRPAPRALPWAPPAGQPAGAIPSRCLAMGPRRRSRPIPRAQATLSSISSQAACSEVVVQAAGPIFLDHEGQSAFA